MDGENRTPQTAQVQPTDDRLLKRNRRRRVLALLKSLILPCILLVIVAAIVAFIYVNRDKINSDTVREIITVGNSSYTSIGGSADLGHDRTVRLAPFLDGVIAVSTSEVRYETANGGSGFSVNAVFSVPGVSVSGGYCAAFDIGGSHVLVADKNGSLASADVPGEIVSATVGYEGRLAVVSSVPGYRSDVSVYDRKLRLLYRWQTPDYYVTAAAVSGDGSMLAAAVAYISDGELHSCVKLFSLDAEGVVAESRSYSGLCLSLWATDHGFGLLLDNGVVAIDTSAKEVGYTSFGGDPLNGFCFDGKGGIAVLLAPERSGERFRVLRISDRGETEASLVVNDDAVSIAAYGESTALLKSGSVYLYGRGLALEKVLTPTKLNVYSVMLIKDTKLLLRTENELLAY